MDRKEVFSLKEKRFTFSLEVGALLFFLLLAWLWKDDFSRIPAGPLRKGEAQIFSCSGILLFAIIAAVFNFWVLNLPRYGKIVLVAAIYYCMIILFTPSIVAGIILLSGLIKIGIFALRRWITLHVWKDAAPGKGFLREVVWFNGEVLPVVRESVYLLVSFGIGASIYRLIIPQPFRLPEETPGLSFSILALILCVLVIKWAASGTREVLRKATLQSRIEFLPVAWQGGKVVLALAAVKGILILGAGVNPNFHPALTPVFLVREILTLIFITYALIWIIILLNNAERLNEKMFTPSFYETVNYILASGIVAGFYILYAANQMPAMPVSQYMTVPALLLSAMVVFLFLHLFNVFERIITERIRVSTRSLKKINLHTLKVHLAMLLPLGLLIATVYAIDPRFLILLAPVAVMYRSLRDYSQIHAEALTTIEDLALAFESRDPFTRSHSQNVAQIAGEIAKEMYLEDDEIERIVSAGKLHDLGKIGISDEILGKGRFEALSYQEYEEIRKHPEMARQITGSLSWYEEEANFILHHHEWYNGSGYPQGLIGEEIPLGSRILAVAEAFDYLVSRSPYRDPVSLDLIIEELKKKSGTQFDPEVVTSLLTLIAKKKSQGDLPGSFH